LRSGVEIVRDHYAAHNGGDAKRAASFWADDAELTISVEGPLQAGEFHGRTAVGRWFADWFASFEPGVRFEVNEIAELDDGQVLVVAEQQARGRSSGLEVHQTVAWVYEVRGGKIARAEAFSSREAAFEARAARG
jgi:ketosteroid isomerase-like protein